MLISVPSALRFSAAAAACAGLLAIATPPAGAAPATDNQGYVDSTARCTAPAVVAAFGSTSSSRVAICKTADKYEYRGVRLRDGAKLVVPAKVAGDGYVAESEGFTYTLNPKSLVVRLGKKVIRDEPVADFQRPGGPGAAPPPAAVGNPGAAPAPATPSPTPTTPLPPPLAAEVGGGAGR